METEFAHLVLWTKSGTCCLPFSRAEFYEEASEATSSFAFVRQLTSSFVPAQSDVFFFEIGGNGEEQRTL
jgi:hypothetical protein